MNPRHAIAPVLLSGLLAVITGAPTAEAQSCGELGGDYCSQSGYCPTGFNSLGDTGDPCSPCCQRGPSCGELGGDYCSHSGSCPAGFRFLGRTYEPCNPCCESPPASAPTCGQLGGTYCSPSGSCPAGHRSLGWTSDPCNPCCQQLSGQSMSGSVYAYTDAGSDFSSVWSVGVTESDYNVYGHRYSVQTTITSPKGRTSTATGGESTTHSTATASLPWSFGDLGQYDIVTTYREYCPIVNQGWALAPSKTHIDLHYSLSCWYWAGKLTSNVLGEYQCKYDNLAINPCVASCVPRENHPRVPTYPWHENVDCPKLLLWAVPFYRTSDGGLFCSPGGIGTGTPACLPCGDYSVPAF